MTEAKVYQQILVELEGIRREQKPFEFREMLAKKHGVSLEELAIVEGIGFAVHEMHGYGGEYCYREEIGQVGPMEGVLEIILPKLAIGVKGPIQEPFVEHALHWYEGKIEYEKYKEVVQEKFFEILTALYQPVVALYFEELKQFGRILKGQERREKAKKELGKKLGLYIHRKALEGK